MNHRTPEALSTMRVDYPDTPLTEAGLAADWITQFAGWLADAVAAGLPEPNAMVLATASPQGVPSARTVLLKQYDADGLVWFTNYTSRKGTEVAANPYASAVFPWFPMRRQVVVCGRVERVPAAVSAAYFASRPRGANLGAWASHQSQVVPDRDALERSLAKVTGRFPPDAPVPVPPFWGGLRLVPDTVEFWQGRRDRLHDRLRFVREHDHWTVQRVAP